VERKPNGEIVLDPHVTGECVIILNGGQQGRREGTVQRSQDVAGRRLMSGKHHKPRKHLSEMVDGARTTATTGSPASHRTDGKSHIEPCA